MAPPRQALNPTTQSVGLTAKLVTVQSVSADGTQAVCVDRQHVQAAVSLLVQRSKAPLPAAGETWLLTQDLGMWTFAAIVASSTGQFITPGAESGAIQGGAGQRVTITASPPPGPSKGDIWVSGAAGDELFWWSGTAWVAAQLGTPALADGAVTAPKIAPGAITSAQISPAAGITAGQVAFRASDIGGSRVLKGTSQPADPAPGDLWIDPGQGNQLAEWDGNAWTPVLLGAQAIAPGSLTSAQLAGEAGITAAQVSFSVTEIGGTKITFSASPPASPAIGDLWYDAGHGYKLSQWSGSSWAPYQFGTQAIAAGAITARLIAANTITAAQVAAGIILAGVVDGTEIIGAQFTADGTGGELLAYDGTPALGRLIASVNAQPFFTDSFGNPVGVGVFAYSSPSSFAALQGGDVLVQDGAFPWEITVDPATQGLAIYLPHTGQGVQVSPTGVVAGGAGSAETWHVVGAAGQPAYGTGFGVPSGDQHPRFRLEPLGGGVARLDGVAVTTAATAAGAPMFTLPSGYWPQDRKRFIAVNDASGYAGGGDAVIQVTAAGVVQCVPACSAAGQQIALEGACWPVD